MPFTPNIGSLPSISHKEETQEKKISFKTTFKITFDNKIKISTQDRSVLTHISSHMQSDNLSPLNLSGNLLSQKSLEREIKRTKETERESYIRGQHKNKKFLCICVTLFYIVQIENFLEMKKQ